MSIDLPEQTTAQSETSGGLHYFIRFTALLSVLVLPNAFAVTDYWDVDGANGTLYIHGTLVENACHLDMNSAYQEINLGSLSTEHFNRPGDQGHAVPFEIKLEKCFNITGTAYGTPSLHKIRYTGQPLVEVYFSAVADNYNHELIRMEGVSGVGIRIMDQFRNNIAINSFDKTTELTAGDNILSFRLAPEKTTDSLSVGKFNSLFNFHLKYY
ncbi:hypothetical protein FKD80_20945 [Salmonella enterica]|nr:hypothetical protein [Salmonella enterica]